MTKINKRECLKDVRRVAIDILQAGNYIESGKYDQAKYNISETISSLKEIIYQLKN